MHHFLKAMGFWIWGLIAIGLSVTLVSVNFRMLSIFNRHDTSVASKLGPPTSSLSSTHEFSAADRHNPQSSPEKGTSKGKGISNGRAISRILAKEMTVAQKALQAGQWQEALRFLDAAEQKSGLTAFDKKTIGELDVESGELYYGFGDYKNAVTAINRGLDKGGIKHLDEAYVCLGLSRAGTAGRRGSGRSL